VTNFTNELALCKLIFIDCYDRFFIKEDHIEPMVDKLLMNLNTSFMEVFG
jgi:hypothetical protein